MSRLQIVLTVLIGVLLVVIFWFLVYTPAQDEIEELETQIEQQQAQQAQLETQLERLRTVRSNAPEAESQLAFARSIVPDDPSLPSMLRQIQSAGDDAGVTLTVVTASRPAMIDEEIGLAEMGLTVQVAGTYFQSVDFLRRLEDPTITPRGLLWESLSVARTAEYPELTLNLGGTIFTMSTAADIPEEEEEPEEPAPDAEEGDEDLLEDTTDPEEDAA